MSNQPAARTPGAKRAGPGEHLFDLASINHIKGGPDYSSVEGGGVEGDRMIVALMRMPAGTGAETHSHPNEQWIYILEGTFEERLKASHSQPRPAQWSMSRPTRCIREKPPKTATWCFLPARMPRTACMGSGPHSALPHAARSSVLRTIFSREMEEFGNDTTPHRHIR